MPKRKPDLHCYGCGISHALVDYLSNNPHIAEALHAVAAGKMKFKLAVEPASPTKKPVRPRRRKAE